MLNSIPWYAYLIGYIVAGYAFAYWMLRMYIKKHVGWMWTSIHAVVCIIFWLPFIVWLAIELPFKIAEYLRAHKGDKHV